MTVEKRGGGPKTAKGKARSSVNAKTHGLSSIAPSDAKESAVGTFVIVVLALMLIVTASPVAGTTLVLQLPPLDQSLSVVPVQLIGPAALTATVTNNIITINDILPNKEALDFL